MSEALTVADSKRAFHSAFPYVISPLYRRMVDELLVELHLLSRQRGFQPDALFATGLVQVFDGFSQGYRPEGQREALFTALCSSSGFDGAVLRGQHQQAVAAMGHHRMEEVRQWIEHQGEGAPAPVAEALAGIRREDFHYSRLMAVGLLTLLERAGGSDGVEPGVLREAAHNLGVAMGLLRDRLDKDLSLYAANLEKMAQAVELMEETLAADRRRRERQADRSEKERQIAAEVKGSDQGVPSAG
ncbi:MAG: photosystem II biogenesis protein Psp29 [Cyanobium sp.]